MPVIRNDPCGWTCLLMTYAAVIYADYVIIKWVVLQTMQNSAWGIGKLFYQRKLTLLWQDFTKIIPYPRSAIALSFNQVGFN